MERLPYIDEHAISVPAAAADTWSAVLRRMCRNPDDPTPPVGFRIEEATAPERLALKGRHLFAVYRLVFELDSEREGVRLRALTFADFPGPHGRVYRALVIGTGVHRIVVRRMLNRIAAEALGVDYVDAFEVPISDGDVRSAEQAFRDALGDEPGAFGSLVLWIHRHVLRFRLGPSDSPDHIIGWQIVRSEHDEIVLTAQGPLLRGQLTLRREDGRRATLTTRLHYCHQTAARTVWAFIGPLHRVVAPRLMERTAQLVATP
jgi:hypothetical protein